MGILLAAAARMEWAKWNSVEPPTTTTFHPHGGQGEERQPRRSPRRAGAYPASWRWRTRADADPEQEARILVTLATGLGAEVALYGASVTRARTTVTTTFAASSPQAPR